MTVDLGPVPAQWIAVDAAQEGGEPCTSVSERSSWCWSWWRSSTSFVAPSEGVANLVDLGRMATDNTESALARLVGPHHARADDEARTLLGEVCTSSADLEDVGRGLRFGSIRTPRLAAHGPSPGSATSPPPPGPPARGQPSSSSARSTCRADHPELLPQCWQVRSRSDTGGGTRPRRSATRYGSARRHGMRSCSTAGRSRRSGRTGRPTSTLDSSCARWATGPPERRRSPRP